MNDIAATAREPGPDETPEMVEAERQAAQEFIDNGNPFFIPLMECWTETDVK
jgi:SWI/SNF-related matrix-associated actin-dependent regulator of chromatin subfamily A member 5